LEEVLAYFEIEDPFLEWWEREFEVCLDRTEDPTLLLSSDAPCGLDTVVWESVWEEGSPVMEEKLFLASSSLISWKYGCCKASLAVILLL